VEFVRRGMRIPYENSISRNDRTFDLFISENLGFPIKRLIKAHRTFHKSIECLMLVFTPSEHLQRM
jgi:hypothetical protein